MHSRLNYYSQILPYSPACIGSSCHVTGAHSVVKYASLLIDFVLVHVTCSGPHVKGHDVYLVWAKTVEMCVFPALILFSLQLTRNVSYWDCFFCWGSLILEWEENGIELELCGIIRGAHDFYPLVLLPWLYSGTRQKGFWGYNWLLISWFETGEVIQLGLT